MGRPQVGVSATVSGDLRLLYILVCDNFCASVTNLHHEISVVVDYAHVQTAPDSNPASLCDDDVNVMIRSVRAGQPNICCPLFE